MTFADLIERTRRHLYTETRDQRNRLTGALTSNATTLAVDFDLNGIQPGAILAIDLEELYVWSVTASNIEVARGHNGSTAATHAAGSMIYVNPKHSTFAISAALNDDIIDLSSPANGLYRVARTAITYDAAIGGYDLGVTDFIDLIEVAFDINDASRQWPTIPRADWRIKRNMPTATFASGTMLSLNTYAEPGRPLNIVYKAPFVTLSALADDVDDTGLPSTALDLPPLGAAINLTVGAEVARNFLSQGETRRSQEVPPGARLGEMRGLAAQRATRISAESARLYAQYPVLRA